MKPERFVSLLLSWICADQQVRARSFAEAGYGACPFGVELWLPTRARVYLQAVGRSPVAAPGADSGSAQIVEGEALPEAEPVELPTDSATPLALVERWLAWRITTGRCPEIKTVEPFQEREKAGGAVVHGVGVRCWSGARLWVYFRHATPPGREPGRGPVFRVQATV